MMSPKEEREFDEWYGDTPPALSLAWLVFWTGLAFALLFVGGGCARPNRQPEVTYYAPGAEVFTAPKSTWPGAAPIGRVQGLPNGDKVIPLRYPPINLTNYTWDLEASADLVHWVTLQTNTGPGDLWVTNARRREFQAFRMHGHL